MIATDAAGSDAKQVADVDSMIAQGIVILFLPPREEKPLIPAVMKAKAAGIPTFLVDRSVDPAVAQAGRDYVAFLGSDFIDQGRRVAEWTLEVKFAGRPLHVASPCEAQAAGISTIYQELTLVPLRSVTENVILGYEPRTRLGLINWRAAHANASWSRSS